MLKLISYLDCGNVYITKERADFRVTKFSDVVSKIIPFFKLYNIKGRKLFDFTD
jgi:hypothetical protein